MNKRILGLFCCGIIIVSSGCKVQNSSPPVQEQKEVVLETITVSDEEYYLLSDEEDLLAIGNTHPLSGNYILENDIILSGEWEPIGNSSEPFTGIFDGNGYSIKNLTVTKKVKEMGFFGAAKDAVIKSLVLENVNIDIFSFFPIVYYAESTEITGCSIKGVAEGEDVSKERGSAILGLDEEEQMIEELMEANYQSKTLSEFHTLVLNIFEDTDTLLSVIIDLENYFDNNSEEAGIVSYTLPATYSELTSKNNSGSYTGVLKRERTAGRVIMDTIEFSCNIEYKISYDIFNTECTVSERDEVLKSIHSQMQKYVDSAEEIFLVSPNCGNEINEYLQVIVSKCTIEDVSISAEITRISVLDENGEYQTVFSVE